MSYSRSGHRLREALRPQPRRVLDVVPFDAEDESPFVALLRVEAG
jgi:hypothetical protein